MTNALIYLNDLRRKNNISCGRAIQRERIIITADKRVTQKMLPISSSTFDLVQIGTIIVISETISYSKILITR